MLGRWLRVFIVLKEDLNSGPSTCVGQLTTACNCRVSDTLFWSQWAPVHTHVHTHAHTCAQY